jgi:hypothetical protein
MGDWLVTQFTLFGVPLQSWMLLALVVILIGVLLARWKR